MLSTNSTQFLLTFSSDIVGNIVQQLGLKNMGIAVGILIIAVPCLEIVLVPVWVAAISISGIRRLSVTSYIIEQVDLEKMDIAIGFCS